MTRPEARRQRGVAYPFWLRVDQLRIDQRMTQQELSAASGIRPATINNLQWSSRSPQPRIVFALADVVGLGRDEAKQLAGLAPPPPSDVDIREVIRTYPGYTDQQRALLLGLVDVFEQPARTEPPSRTAEAG